MTKEISHKNSPPRFWWLLAVIIIIAAFVRLYRIGDYLHFLGDEGRDVLVVKRMIVDKKITLLGPITSVGSMYLGPIYYYFMIPFLFLFSMDPVGPAIMIVIFSLITIYIMYRIGIDFFDWKVAIISSLFYALSPLVITQSRFSWNPNAVPLFAAIIIYSLLHICVKNSIKWWPLIIGLALGVILQLHYLSLIFLIIIALCLAFFKKFSPSILAKIFIGTIITLSPFILFEFRHQFPNTQTVLGFVTKQGQAATLSFEKSHLLAKDLLERAFLRIVVIQNLSFTWLVITSVAVVSIIVFKSKNGKEQKQALLVLYIWLFTTIAFLALYKGAVYDYYLVQLFPLPALLAAFSISYFSRHALPYIKIIGWLVFAAIIYFQILNSPLFDAPNRLLPLTKERVRFILNIVKEKPYNFALLTERNSDHAYRYFLEVWDNPPLVIENPQVDPDRKSVTDQLIVVCELNVVSCTPLGHPLWEIAGFGPAEIDDSWDVAGVKILKLKHYKEDSQL